MPKRNIVKVYGADQFYHCYNRGVNRQDIFIDDDDYGYFLSLFRRHLSLKPTQDKTRRPYPHYYDEVELVAYCLMKNHYHLLIYLKDTKGAEHLMRSIMTAYSRYFNIRYSRTGSLFEGNFLAARITSDDYLWHVSRYIHLNPLDIGQQPLDYTYSSIGYYAGKKSAEWLHEDKLVETPQERHQYLDSIRDNNKKDYQKLINRIDHQLATSD